MLGAARAGGSRRGRRTSRRSSGPVNQSSLPAVFGGRRPGGSCRRRTSAEALPRRGVAGRRRDSGDRASARSAARRRRLREVAGRASARSFVRRRRALRRRRARSRSSRRRPQNQCNGTVSGGDRRRREAKPDTNPVPPGRLPGGADPAALPTGAAGAPRTADAIRAVDAPEADFESRGGFLTSGREAALARRCRHEVRPQPEGGLPRDRARGAPGFAALLAAPDKARRSRRLGRPEPYRERARSASRCRPHARRSRPPRASRLLENGSQLMIVSRAYFPHLRVGWRKGIVKTAKVVFGPVWTMVPRER